VDQTAGAFIEEGRPGQVRLVGEVDIAGVPEIQARLERSGGSIEVDCSGVTFIDSSGLGMLVAVQRACSARGAKLSIVDPSPPMIHVLELTGLDNVLEVRRNGSTP
jgi:anti-sigma B factor antagonist